MSQTVVVGDTLCLEEMTKEKCDEDNAVKGEDRPGSPLAETPIVFPILDAVAQRHKDVTDSSHAQEFEDSNAASLPDSSWGAATPSLGHLSAFTEWYRRTSEDGCVPTVGSGEDGGCVPTVGSGEDGGCVSTVGSGEDGGCVPTVGSGTDGGCVPTVGSGTDGDCVPIETSGADDAAPVVPRRQRRRLGVIHPPLSRGANDCRLSVSFGDVTVCDKLNVHPRRKSLPCNIHPILKSMPSGLDINIRRQSLPCDWDVNPRTQSQPCGLTIKSTSLPQPCVLDINSTSMSDINPKRQFLPCDWDINSTHKTLPFSCDISTRRKSLPSGLDITPRYRSQSRDTNINHRRRSLPCDLDINPYDSVSNLSFFDDIILAAATPALGPDISKRHTLNSFLKMIGGFPERLANKSHFDSCSSLATSRSSLQEPQSLPSVYVPRSRRSTEQQEELELQQIREGCLPRVSGNVYPRVMRPYITHGGFSAWKDVDSSAPKMYGRYTKDLSRYARQEAKKLKTEEKSTLESGTSGLRPYRGKVASKCVRFLSTVWRATFARVGEDWVFLAMLGVVMAIISFIMDYGIAMCNKARLWLYRDLASHTALQYLAWVSLPVCLILFSAGFSHLLAPQAVGSGIPEMKTILRGVVLKEYLTFKTLIAKVIGLTATLGTGLPLGKEGPFVHIASLVATLLSKAVTSFKGIYENESRNSEMLAAACAVGVACCFAAPVGGVLFSIEVTSVYFAVRNYWRGFFAAVCGAMMFRLLAVWFNDEETLTALFKTNFKVGYPFDPQELFVFALVGVLCGFLGALFVYSHRRYVIFMRKNKKMKAFLQKSRLLYPFFITMIYGSLSFPLGLGQFFGTELGGHQQVIELFSNITWTKEVHTVQEFTIVENWRTPWTGIFVSLIIYSAFTFFGCVICSTLPVPSGLFIPVFKTGAAVGRIVGEIMASTFPNGLRYGGHNHIIIPGGYSIVGAAALAGAVTHTISTSVIVFELTGQITHILPVMIAVLIANGIAQLLQPSIYDSIIQIKKLPYLPDILTATSGAYNIYVEDFMVRDVKYIWYGIAYRELKNILKEHKKIRSLPLVDSPDSMILLGSIQRSELISMLEEHLGKDRRLRVINKWKFAAQKVLEAEQLHEMGQNQHENERKRAKQRLLDIEEAIKRKPTTVPSGSLTLMAGMGADENDSLLVPSTVPTVSAPPSMTPAPPSMTPVPPSMTPAPASVIPAPSMIPAPPSIIPSSNIPAPPSIFLEVPSTSASTISSTATTITTPNTVAPLPVIMTDMMEVLGKQERRPSRFEVTKIETPSKENESSIALQIDAMEIPAASEPTLDRDNTFRRNTMPKSILKKTNSFILHPTASSPIASPQHTPYATVHAGDSKLRQAFESVIRKTNLRNGSDKEAHSTQSVNSNNPKRVSLPMERMVEMTLEEQRRWEEEELDKEVDFSKCHIDPAPFQLVERTSLLKVHSLFSMLGLNHAYVTAIGRIIGVVALKELRKAIEETNSGDFPKADPAPAATSTRATDASSSTEATKEGSKE